jgi:hypothetical protein
MGKEEAWGRDEKQPQQTNQNQRERLNDLSHFSCRPHSLPYHPLLSETIVHFTNPLLKSILKRKGERETKKMKPKCLTGFI